MKVLMFATSLVILNGCAPSNQSNHESRNYAPLGKSEPLGGNRSAPENADMVSDVQKGRATIERENSVISKVEAVEIISSVPNISELSNDSDSAGRGEGDKPMEADPMEADPMEADPMEADPMEADPMEAAPMEEIPSTFKLKVSISNDCEGWRLYRKVGPSRYRSDENFRRDKEIDVAADGEYRVQPFYDERDYASSQCDDDESASCSADSYQSLSARGGDKISMNFRCSCSCR
jgi:hypothetical protein